MFSKTINAKIKANLPTAIANHIPLAPPAYNHNDPQSISMGTLNLN